MPRPDKSSPEYAAYKAEKRARRAAREARHDYQSNGAGEHTFSSSGAVINLDTDSNDRGRERAYSTTLAVSQGPPGARSRSRHRESSRHGGGSPPRVRESSRVRSNGYSDSDSDSAASHHTGSVSLRSGSRSSAHVRRSRAVSFRDERESGQQLGVPQAIAALGGHSRSRSNSAASSTATASILARERGTSDAHRSTLQQQHNLYPEAKAAGGSRHARHSSTSVVEVSRTYTGSSNPRQQDLYPNASATSGRSRRGSGSDTTSRNRDGSDYPLPSSVAQYLVEDDPYAGDYGPRPSKDSRPLPPPSPGPYAQHYPPPPPASSFSPVQNTPYGSAYPPPPAPSVPGSYYQHDTLPTIPGVPATTAPGEGAGGKVYPPGQTPYQHPNPDYYGDVLSSSHTTHSLSHSLTSTSSGIPGVSPVATPHEGDVNGRPSSLLVPGAMAGIAGLAKIAIDSLSPSHSSHGGAPQPSPALQPYHGTYQSISPLPSPGASPALFAASGSVTLAGHRHSFSLGEPAYPQHHDGEHASTTSTSKDQRERGREKRASRHRSRSRSHSRSRRHHSHSRSRSSGSSHSQSQSLSVSHARPRSRSRSRSRTRKQDTYDPTDDAHTILACLRSSRHAPGPLLRILPRLSGTEITALRTTYKAQHQGISLSKHVKSVYPTTTLVNKLLFAIASGPIESEAWFANSWYQKGSVRNELLIEALMGRSNDDIRDIRKAFRDRKYGDGGLVEAVEKELPRDKFRKALLLQLSADRMDEHVRPEMEAVKVDVARLGNILESGRSGGETELVEIIVSRSERWLKDVAAVYRATYNRGLDRAVMKHSKNLVVRLPPPPPLFSPLPFLFFPFPSLHFLLLSRFLSRKV